MMAGGDGTDDGHDDNSANDDINDGCGEVSDGGNDHVETKVLKQ